MIRFRDFSAAIASGRKHGRHVFVQCLPKMGSTALSCSLPDAVHEFGMDAAPLLIQQHRQPDFDDLRWQWLQQRRQQLAPTVDICTSLFLLTAELSDQALDRHGHQRFLLNRSLRPWLRSISNWSYQNASNPLRHAWDSSYRLFVHQSDPELQAVMPQSLNSLRSMVRFWMPVWLVYQRWIAIHMDIGIAHSPSILMTDDNGVIPTNANRSHFSKGFEQSFNRLIPAMPSLGISPERNRAFQQDLRSKLLAMPASAP